MKPARTGTDDGIHRREDARFKALLLTYLNFLESPLVSRLETPSEVFDAPVCLVPDGNGAISLLPFTLPAPLKGLDSSPSKVANLPDDCSPLLSLFLLSCQQPLSRALCAELARVTRPGGWVAGVVPSPALTPSALATLLDELSSPDALGLLLRHIPLHYPDGFSERLLVSRLLEAKLRCVRTAEALDGLLLFFKARR